MSPSEPWVYPSAAATAATAGVTAGATVAIAEATDAAAVVTGAAVTGDAATDDVRTCQGRYVLALLSAGLLQKFQAYLFYLSLIGNKNQGSALFIFSKILHFTYMLLRFRLIIPSFPAQIDDMCSRFSALSMGHGILHACETMAPRMFNVIGKISVTLLY